MRGSITINFNYLLFIYINIQLRPLEREEFVSNILKKKHQLHRSSKKTQETQTKCSVAVEGRERGTGENTPRG
jgi:hypothetical protein